MNQYIQLKSMWEEIKGQGEKYPIVDALGVQSEQLTTGTFSYR